MNIVLLLFLLIIIWNQKTGFERMETTLEEVLEELRKQSQ